MNGLLIIDKPGGMTSHDVVQRIRKLLNTSKVGHLGTLDPMATGVLPLCVGNATRIGQFFATAPKEYLGGIRFGFPTTTYDREGEPTAAESVFGHTEEEVALAMRELSGDLQQTPPAFSAKKIAGEASHKLARRGIAVENNPVKIHVASFELRSYLPPLIGFRVVCSGGTYVRSLAHDLGQKLGCGAHLDSLRRVQSGEFSISQATALADVTAADLIPIESLLTGLPSITVNGDLEEDRVRHGNPVPSAELGGFTRIFNKKGQFLAVAAIESGWAHPRVVLTSVASVEARRPR